MVAVLSTILVAFMVAQRDERASSLSYSQSIKADDLAVGGADFVIQTLRTEIEDPARSTVLTAAGGPPIYMPKTNAFILPERMASSAVPSTLTNLLKISSASVPFYTNGPTLAAPSSSAASSINSRSLNKTRWNRPMLVDLDVTNDFVTPDWIVMTRSGPVTTWSPALKDPKSANAIIGRFAFAVYDIAGLLDVSSAGYPASLSGTEALRHKGMSPFADLSQIPGFLDPNAFVNWRNAASGTNSASFTNHVYGFGVTNGFLKTPAGDRTFFSRQDLIQYAKANSNVLSTNALPYLTTFTREFNAPSYSPRTPTGSSIDYASLANETGSVNANLAAARDNSGQLLLKKRFPLTRIDLLKSPGSNASRISDYFGLTLSSDDYSWNYQDSTIKTLAEVALLGRLPNFFELLQAAILRGSLGLATSQGNYSPFMGSALMDGDATRQILAIGANIIDQYDSDSMPTVIHRPSDTTGLPLTGNENIPSLNEMMITAYRPTEAEGGDPSRKKLILRMSFEVWNPHQNAPTLPTDGPANFRVVTRDGAFRIMAFDPYPPPAPPKTSAPAMTSSPAVDYEGTYSPTTPNQIQFQNQVSFQEPTVLTPSNSHNLNAAGQIGSTSGIVMGTFDSLLDDRLPSSTVTYQYHSLQFTGELDSIGPQGFTYSISVEAQFLDSKGNWQTYQRFPYGLSNTPSNNPTIGDMNPAPNFRPWTGLDLAYPQLSLSRIDPRGSRWGAARIYLDANSSMDRGTPGTSIRPNSGYGFAGGEGTPVGPGTTQLFWPNGNRSWDDRNYAGMMSDNDPATENAASTRAVGYKDPDGVGRKADGNTTRNVLPMATGQLSDRPVILNRPFRSVAEMGYAFRDMPWKTLDFHHGASADIGLIDVFTANDDAETTNSVVAGKISLNSPHPEVLAAMLSRAAIVERDISKNITDASALQIAQDIVAATKSDPFMNKADLISVFASQKEAIFDANYADRKAERESFVRALVDAGQTRTWNLLIDIVAQTGKYPATADNFDKFHVEGERRYWLHVAIDRFTGDVLDSQLEPVYE